MMTELCSLLDPEILLLNCAHYPKLLNCNFYQTFLFLLFNVINTTDSTQPLPAG
jgi:hypothetical protein